MRQRKLGSHTPPCHRRMVITTLFSVFLAALQRRPILYHTRWLLTVFLLRSSGHRGQLAPTTLPQCRLVSNPCPAGRAPVKHCQALALWHVRTCRTQTSGAQWRLWWRKGVSTFQQKVRLPDTSTLHCRTVCGACLFSTTPCVHKQPTLSCPLVFNALSWAAFSRPSPCFGFPTRNDMSRLCSRGAMAPCCFTIILLCVALASHTPWSAQTHHPPFAPVSPRLLLCGSLSHSLPLVLSCSLPCAPPSLSLLSVPVPLRPTLSLSLSLSHKRGFRGVRCITIPPGFEPSSAGQKRCG